jgi:anti-anti-sigma regulatory factor
LYGIEVRESEGGLLVELWGEFDAFCIGGLKRTLNEASSRRGPAFFDLSGITFLDLRSARELAVRSMLRAHHPIFVDPSPQVTATMAALGLEGWPNFPPGTGGRSSSASSEPRRPEAGTRFLYVSPPVT